MLLEACGSAAPLLHGMHLALALAQQLVVLMEAPHVIMVTCGAVAFGDSASDAAHGGAWGFARVVRLEHTALRTQSSDIAHGERLVASAVLLSPTPEAEVAWSGNVHGVARLRACTLSSSKANAPLAAGAYAITGGLGGLGLCAAKMLVESGASGIELS
jgi:phthiocerol/phenolphthiocerol synthesis type-I polyketide synthase D